MLARAALNRLAASESTERIRPSSAFALKVALAALEDGLGGTLTIHIPDKPGAPIEVEYTTRSHA